MRVRPLSGTGYLDDALSFEQSKEVLAHFGLAVHASNVLESGILNSLFAAEIVPRRREFDSKEAWGHAYDQFFESGFKQTFGQLVRRVRESSLFSCELVELLEACTKVRNHLVHHSQREGAEAIFSKSGREDLIQSYESAVSLFGAANDNLEEELEALHAALGIDTELLRRRIEHDMRKLVTSAGS